MYGVDEPCGTLVGTVCVLFAFLVAAAVAALVYEPGPALDEAKRLSSAHDGRVCFNEGSLYLCDHGTCFQWSDLESQ